MRKKNKQNDDEDNQLREWLKKIADKCILALQSKEKKLFRAILEMNIPKIRKYIYLGANTNYEPKFDIPFVRGDSFLHYLAQRASTDEEIKLIETFIKHGADVNKRNCINQTPLHNACIAGNHKIVAFLLLNGADINAQDNNGKTPLHLAMARHHLETIQILIHFQANTNLTDNYGYKPQDCIKKLSVAETVKNILDTIKPSINAQFMFNSSYPREHFAVINNSHFVTQQTNNQFANILKLNQYKRTRG